MELGGWMPFVEHLAKETGIEFQLKLYDKMARNYQALEEMDLKGLTNWGQ